ncbi:hypothetical protein [Chakrabartyella piscis]|uniref:hypothetical protein n=1 Tax=Chakrabartyella piscis TaxID=2918914 RepID=UPI002958B114|nr:hypothetical protein [Chakrabartyella piscis]
MMTGGTISGDETVGISLSYGKNQLYIETGDVLVVPEGLTLIGTTEFTLTLVTLTQEMIQIPEYVYTGSTIDTSAIAIATEFDIIVTIADTEFVLDLSNFNTSEWTQTFTDVWGNPLFKITNAGTYYVVYTKDGVSVEKVFTVLQSGTEFVGVADKTAHYGEAVFVTITPEATGEVAELSSIEENQMALFVQKDGIDIQITEAQDVESGVALLFAIDTRNENLVLGTNTIVAKYTGNDNMEAYAESFVLLLEEAIPTNADGVLIEEATIVDNELQFTVELEEDANLMYAIQLSFALYDEAGRISYIGDFIDIQLGNNTLTIDGAESYTNGKIFVMDEGFASLLPTTQITIGN